MTRNTNKNLVKNKKVTALKLSAIVLTPALLLSCSQKVVNQPPIVVTQPTYPTYPDNHSHPSQPTYPTYPTYPQQPTQPPTTGGNYGQQGSFAGWKADFSRRAIAAGHNPQDVRRLMDMAQYNSQVVSLDSNQAEFVKMPWDYVENAVSASKVSTGRQKYANNPNTFGQIANRYNVPPHIVTAIWGMESSYGGYTGKSNLASALATLAYDGRRREFAENQLMALLTLLNRGDVSWYNMEGSWAGGMGHTQFIPATWLSFGVDANGDGQRNPWNPDDALSSTANYLTRSGWVRGLDPYYEVSLPAGFNYTQTGSTKSVAQWQSMGVQLMGGYLNGNTPAKLWLPAGQDGPALLLTKNFDVIKVYNNSSSYALAVSLLGKRIAGGSGLQKSWPKYEQPISKYQARQLQQRLTDLGYDTKGIDGVIGTNTRKAFQRWQADNGHVADGFISQRTTRGLVY